jgi:hypothetical protein
MLQQFVEIGDNPSNRDSEQIVLRGNKASLSFHLLDRNTLLFEEHIYLKRLLSSRRGQPHARTLTFLYARMDAFLQPPTHE